MNTPENIRTKKFKSRSFIAIAMFLSGLILPVSGIMNHTLQFDNLTQERHFWMSIHNMAGLIFAITTICHITLNWKTLMNYLNKAKTFLFNKEAVTAFLFVIILVGLAALHTFHLDK